VTVAGRRSTRWRYDPETRTTTVRTGPMATARLVPIVSR
jgi:hypothetical protein